MKRLGVLVMAEPDNGGTYQYTLSMLEALRNLKKWNITLYTAAENHHYDNFDYPVCRIAASRKNWPKLILQDSLHMRGEDLFSQEDLLLAPIYSPLLLHAVKPFAFTLHDLQEYYFPQNFSWLQRVWRRFINFRLTSRASRIICESEYVRQDIVRLFGVPTEKIAVIPAPPVTMGAVDASPGRLEATHTKYQLPDQYLFYPAQFWPHKNHMRLLDAFAQITNEFPGVHLVLTGKKRDEYNKVFAHVRNLGLEEKVRHIGYVEQAELAALYQLALCLVMPSLFESISIPVYEAFQCGTPVCASAVVALPEQVGDAGLLFDPLSVDSIANSIRSILRDKDLRDRLANSGRTRFKVMTHEQYAKQLDSLLENL